MSWPHGYVVAICFGLVAGLTLDQKQSGYVDGNRKVIDTGRARVDSQLIDAEEQDVAPNGGPSTNISINCEGIEDQDVQAILFNKVASNMSLCNNAGNVAKAVKELRQVAEDPNFFSHLEEGMRKAKDLSVAYVQESDMRVAEFEWASAQTSNESLTKLLVRLLDRSEASLVQHQAGMRQIGEDLIKEMPAYLSSGVLPLLEQITPRAIPRRFDTSELSELSLEQACNQSSAIMDDIQRYGSLNSTRDALADAGKLIPQLTKLVPDLTPQVQSMMDTLIGACVFETTALENASRSLVRFVAPIVLERFQCVWEPSAAGPRRRVLISGVGAMLVASAAFRA